MSSRRLKIPTRKSRIPFEATVSILADDQTIDGQFVSISAADAFIETPPVLPLGQQVRVTFDIPGILDTCDIPGVVRWTKRGRGIGLQFGDIRPIEVWALSKLGKGAR